MVVGFPCPAFTKQDNGFYWRLPEVAKKGAGHDSNAALLKLSKNPFGAFRQKAAASRKVFSATYTPRQKMISIFSPLRRRTLRGFFDKLTPGPWTGVYSRL